MNLPRGRASGIALPLISPFAIGRGHDLLREYRCHDAHPAAVLRAVLPPADFRAWLRTTVYDAVHSSRQDDYQIVELLGMSSCQRILSELPHPRDSDAEGYCPRCGSQYRVIDALCADCGLTVRAWA